MLVSLEQKFMERVMPEPNSGCWLWMGALSGKPGRQYGMFNRGRRGNRIGAHVFSYQLKFGQVPDGLELDHKCRMPCCVNPDHLEAVTHAENVRRGTAPAALHAKKTTCPRGHPYDVMRKRGERACRKCHAEQQRRRKRAAS